MKIKLKNKIELSLIYNFKKLEEKGGIPQEVELDVDEARSFIVELFNGAKGSAIRKKTTVATGDSGVQIMFPSGDNNPERINEIVELWIRDVYRVSYNDIPLIAIRPRVKHKPKTQPLEL